MFANSQEASQKVAERMIQAHDQENARVFGLATGSTPIELYQLLSQSAVDFSDSIAINLDEYYGLDQNHPQSYHTYMQNHLFRHKPFAHSYIPNGHNLDVDQEIQAYDQILKNHPIDLQLLGLGKNGHIGFNEPGSDFTSHTQLVNLTESTIQANQRFFNHNETVPTQAYSMGIASILAAKEIILLAFGEHKAQAVQAMVEGPVTPDLPASVLQTHPKVSLYLDEAAAHLLKQS
nr:glucosamine-6-phosphate deaminase [Vaginisenegalia massiliensis]